ncbi:unnamed protein product [Larinioides sclopetarius]|uniref:Uncharacterized protein n=1 Tax=Larinioides sclopetarius TaxID=280406 RepID=A0AAV2ADP0_9ARAC
MEYNSVGEGLQNTCSLDENEFKRCYDELISKFKKRYGEASMGMHGPDEIPAFEEGRKCLEAILIFCEANPEGCVSTG